MTGQDADVPTWIMALIALGFFGGLGALAFWIHERRRAGFEKLAARLGLTFEEEVEQPVWLPPEFIAEIETGIVVSTAVRRVLHGSVDGLDVAVCELLRYRARSNGGERGHYSLSVVSVSLPENGLAAFSLQPERLRDKLAELKRGADIDFDDSPDFSRKYLLRGENEEAIRAVFDRHTRDFLARHPGRCVWCYGSQIVYYRPAKLLRWAAFRPSAAERLMNEALHFVRLLRRG